ncbi:CAMK family protein kinase [Trichomonas vaginalis G3]|uniref:CAMK family protein kinase n=1 Tax=Trichomonas vaginalis (strain ATCC PRA-98 / G3) TaxID=412133 RepID=A2ETG3_TRIV3|nr:protein serine/threonine kinase protein [Trichomonas vaginalis G3]EAY04083.1 CAMK family protein kinase [Trichomonas vaginalis G3]KAI5513402.1 protein serine/threonine kinase protein [Trichomonas vaginalis G3]|eukprot:XP_001316306.1 CAMK family protein kinase [Trichomonas vaginalis G3]
MNEEHSLLDTYEICYSIGKGASSEVFYAKHKILGLPVAIKGYPKTTMTTSNQRQIFEHEAEILRSIENPYISALYDVFSDENNYYAVIDLAENGSFESFINPTKPVTENHAKRYFAQLISALSYLHSVHHILHRDIKADNILLDRYFNIKIVDFGVSTYYDPNKPTKLPPVGSPAYMAPEVILHDVVTEKSDIWSAGVFLYFITAGIRPFDAEDIPEICSNIVHGAVTFPSYLSPDLRDLLSKILVKDPKSRWSLEQIAEHPWLSGQKITLHHSGESQFTIDQIIVKCVAETGTDITTLQDDLMAGRFTAATTIYKILKTNVSNPQVQKSRVSIGTASNLKLTTLSQVKIQKPQQEGSNLPALNSPLKEKRRNTYMSLKPVMAMNIHKSNIICVRKGVNPLQ